MILSFAALGQVLVVIDFIHQLTLALFIGIERCTGRDIGTHLGVQNSTTDFCQGFLRNVNLMTCVPNLALEDLSTFSCLYFVDIDTLTCASSGNPWLLACHHLVFISFDLLHLALVFIGFLLIVLIKAYL